MTPAGRIPITMIGGFLGAGKTTLVNDILSKANGRRYVVVVNDFGDINIDLELVQVVEEDRVALTNGCVCCSLNDDLLKSVAGFARGHPRPDGFVIEASGVASPQSLVMSLNTLERSGLTRTDSSIYLVDCSTFSDLEFADREMVLEDASQADFILFNKVDLTPRDQVALLKEEVRLSAPYGVQIETINASVDQIVFDTGTTSLGRGDHVGKMQKRVNQRSHGFKSILFETEDLLDRKRFTDWLTSVSMSCPRAKGFVHFSDDAGQRYLLHLVGRRVSLEATERSGSGSKTQIVVIGRSEGARFTEISAEFDGAAQRESFIS